MFEEEFTELILQVTFMINNKIKGVGNHNITLIDK